MDNTDNTYKQTANCVGAASFSHSAQTLAANEASGSNLKHLYHDLSAEQLCILAINPGSISTKISVFCGDKVLFTRELLHSVSDLAPFEGQSAAAQLEMRTECIVKALEEEGVALSSLSAVACRGGLLKPIPHGTYDITEQMLKELHEARWGDHPCNLGAMIGHSFSKELNIPAYVVDPGVVDELPPRAYITGLKEIRRRCISHALNAFAQTRRYAAEIGTTYDRLNLVVAHIGGGVSIGAHKHGHYIDVNNALDGEGPFSPERSGSLPVGPLIDLCFSGKYTREELRRLNRGKGGMLNLVGTADMREIEARCLNGEEEFVNAMEAMAYAISKNITAMWPAFDGEEIDAVILTGGASRCQILVDKIKKYISAVKVPVVVYPGEWEMIALASGVARVITGQEELKTYPPVSE
ncbi:MAG: butyrate kinase [Candidatus Bruticola sp.]